MKPAMGRPEWRAVAVASQQRCRIKVQVELGYFCKEQILETPDALKTAVRMGLTLPQEHLRKSNYNSLGNLMM